jgi:hypothetical protein
MWIKIETYLPVFPGFAGTWFECDKEELMIEEGNTYDDYNWNYAQYYQDCAKIITSIIGDKLFEEHGVKVKYQSTNSPKYYNFRNDEINIECKLSENDYNNIVIYLQEHKKQFSNYLKERYTSCYGFIPSYSNDIADWMFHLISKENLDHVFGSVLEFILLNEHFDQEELYNEFLGYEVYVEATLIN